MPPPRDRLGIFQALFTTNDELVLVVHRFQTSEPEDAAYVFLVAEDGAIRRRLVITTDFGGVSLSPDGKELGVSGEEYQDILFSRGVLVDRGYWYWVKPLPGAHNSEKVAIGSFIVQLATGDIQPALRGRHYLWEVGGLDATDLMRIIGHEITDAQYLASGLLAFRVLPAVASDEYWNQGRIQLGTASVSMKDWARNVVQLPEELEGFDNELGVPEYAFRFPRTSDGRFIYLRHRRRNELWLLDIHSCNARVLAKRLPGYPQNAWPSPDGRRVVVAYETKGVSNKMRLLLVTLNQIHGRI